MAVALPFTTPKTWLPRLNEQAPPLLSLALALVCGYLLARLIWAVVPVAPDSNPITINEANIELTISFLEEHLPKIKVMRPEASYLIWLDQINLGEK